MLCRFLKTRPAILSGLALMLCAQAAQAQILTPAGEQQVEMPAQEAPPPAVTQNLRETLRHTYNDNPTLKAARAELRAVHERLPLANSGWRPTASANAGVTTNTIDTEPDTGGSDGSTETTLGLNVEQPLYRGGRTTAAVSGAENAIKAQRFLLSATEQAVLFNAVTAYMNLVRDEALYKLAVNNPDLIARQLDATRNRFEVGEITRTDVSQAEARLAGANAGITSAQGNLRSSRAVYEQITGLAPGTLDEQPPALVTLPSSLDDAIELSMSSNPSIQAAEYLEKSTEDSVSEIFGELLPAVSLVGSVSQAYDPSPGTLDESMNAAVGVSATIPLYEAGAVRSRVRQAKQVANQRYMQILESRRSVREDVVTAWETLEAARAEIESRQAQVEASQIAREGVYQETEVGSRTVLDALDADQELLDAQVNLVSAKRDEVVARFSLANALGMMTPEQLGFPEAAVNHDEHLNRVGGKLLSMDPEILEDETGDSP